MKTYKSEISAIERYKKDKVKTEWGYCEDCNKKLILANGDGIMHCAEDLNKLGKIYDSMKSMRQLREEILKIAGIELSAASPNAFDRKELGALHNWMVANIGHEKKKGS